MRKILFSAIEHAELRVRHATNVMIIRIYLYSLDFTQLATNRRTISFTCDDYFLCRSSVRRCAPRYEEDMLQWCWSWSTECKPMLVLINICIESLNYGNGFMRIDHNDMSPAWCYHFLVPCGHTNVHSLWSIRLKPRHAFRRTSWYHLTEKRIGIRLGIVVVDRKCLHI